MGPGRYRTDAAYELKSPRYVREGATWSLKPRFGQRGIAVLPMAEEFDPDPHADDSEPATNGVSTPLPPSDARPRSAGTAPLAGFPRAATSDGGHALSRTAPGGASPRLYHGPRRRRDFIAENAVTAAEVGSPAHRAAVLIMQRDNAQRRAEEARLKRKLREEARARELQRIAGRGEQRMLNNRQRRWLVLVAFAARIQKQTTKISNSRMYLMTRKFQRADRHFTERVFVKWRNWVRSRKLFWAIVTMARFLAKGAARHRIRRKNEAADILGNFLAVCAPFCLLVAFNATSLTLGPYVTLQKRQTMGRMAKAMSKYLRRINKVKDFLRKKAKVLSARRRVLERQWRQELFNLRRDFLQVRHAIAARLECSSRSRGCTQHEYEILGGNAPPLSAAHAAIRLYARGIDDSASLANKVVAPPSAGLAIMRRRASAQFTRRRKRSRAKSSSSSDTVAPKPVVSRGRRVSRRGAILVKPEQQSQIMWRWLEVKMIRRYPDVPANIRDRVLLEAVDTMSQRRREGFRRYVADLNNWEAGISVGHAIVVADLHTVLAGKSGMVVRWLAGLPSVCAWPQPNRSW